MHGINKLIFVSSPLRGDVDKNIKKACKYCNWVMHKGHIPYAPHLFFTRFLDDLKKDDRDAGLQAGLEMLKRCDEVWLFADDPSNLSRGMLLEKELAEKCAIPVKLINPVDTD